MLKIKPLYLIAIVLITALATWKLTLMSRYQSASITLLTVKRLDSSLNAANEIMRQSNKQIIAAFDQKLKDPSTVDKARIWSPIMHAATEQTDRMVLQIEALKIQLKKEAGLKMFDGNERYHEDDIDAATRLIINQGEGTKLMDSLRAFNVKILSLIPQDKRNKMNRLPVDNLFEQTVESYFKSTPAIAGVTLLTKFQNDVLRSGNMEIDFCQYQIACHIIDDFCEKFVPLVSQNTTHLLEGETLEIKVGIGAFSSVNRPVITINGEEQTLNSDGLAAYRLKVKTSSEKVPISVSLIDPNTGEKRVLTSTVSYTVTKQ